MSKKLLLAGVMASLFTGAVAQDITFYPNGRKWAPSLDTYVAGKSLSPLSVRSTKAPATTDAPLSIRVTTTDTAAVAGYLRGLGYTADAVTSDIVITDIPARQLKALAEQDAVLYLEQPRQYYPFMSHARTETGVTRVTTGEGLETPYTGKGVVIGVIDQGFEYGHPAFTNRVVRWGTDSESGTLTDKQPRRDRLDDVGHATHVTNIAAGNVVSGSDNYGIARGADLVLISSDLDNNSVLLQASAIKSYAESKGQPWVINMSFGGFLGPHDGSTSYDRAMSDLTGEGGIMVAAMGNDGGEYSHAFRTIEDKDTPVYLYLRPGDYNRSAVIASEVWSTANDGKTHLTIKPVLVYNRKLYDLLEEIPQFSSAFSTGIDPYSNRQYAETSFSLTQVLSALNLSTNGTAYFLWQVTGEAGDSFHAWTIPASYDQGCSFAAKGSPYKATRGDDEYLVGEGGASIEKAIAVASYNNPISYTALDGRTYSYTTVGLEGERSSFSSKGPQIVDRPKPAIAAPGGVIKSAYSKASTYFANYTNELTEVVTVNGSKYYYGVMSGTSMATPVVTGIVALWLEANPKLTYDQIIGILRETGRRDASVTGAADESGWNALMGYGKIDAYAGLKKALELANTSGINETLNTEQPVTLQKEADAWRVLFNNDESFAALSLYSLDGTLVSTRRIESPRRAQEEVVSLAGLTPGVYLFQVKTTSANLTRKLVVR